MRVVHLIGKNAYWREFILYYQKLLSFWYYLIDVVELLQLDIFFYAKLYLFFSVVYSFNSHAIDSFYPCQSEVAFNLSELTGQTIPRVMRIFLGNSMVCSDIWHKYREWYFEIVIRNFTGR